MRIHGPDMPQGKQVMNQKKPAPASGRIQGIDSRHNSVAAKQAAFFTDKGLNIPPSELMALEAELSAMGLKLSGLDSGSVLKALLLHRHNIPLDPALITNSWENEPPVFERLAVFIENARTLLAGSSLTGGTRSAVEVLVNSLEALFTQLSGGWESVPGLSELFQNSGMAFEWRLLAWYRSGGDPAGFQTLLREDLKGIVIKFLNSLKKRQGRGRIAGKTGHLEQEARSLVDTLTQRQLAGILNEHTEKYRLYLEVPFGDNPGREHAKIWARGQKKPGENTLDPENMSLSFTVEASHLGTVNVLMFFSGKTVSLRFILEEDKFLSLAGGMSAEIGESLMSRGFIVQSVTFGLKVDETVEKERANTKKRTEGVDFKG